MQSNQSDDQTLAQGYSNDGNIIDLEKRLFLEKDETTKKIHQTGFEEIMKFKNSFDSNTNKGLLKVFPSSPPQTNEQNRPAFQQFQENITRIYKSPRLSNEITPQNINAVPGNCPLGNCVHISGLCSSGSLNNSEKLIKNYNYDQNHCYNEEKPLKPILRNNFYRQECEKIDTKRNVTFDNAHLFPNLTSHINSQADQMEYSPTYCNQNNTPYSNMNQSPTFCNKINSTPENDPFKYHYLNVHSHRIPEEKPQVNYVNNTGTPPINSYFHGGFNQNNYDSVSSKFDCCYPQPSTSMKTNEIPANSPYQNFSPDKMVPNSTMSSFNQFYNFSEKFPDCDCVQPSSDKYHFQPTTQERETVIFKRDGYNFHNLVPQVYSSQPCYAIPADAVYFYSDKFELYINAKLLIPERIKLNILPEKVELYGCTEQACNNTSSLIEIIRVYDLPAKIIPEQSNCFLSPDGILYLTSKWEHSFK